MMCTHCKWILAVESRLITVQSTDPDRVTKMAVAGGAWIPKILLNRLDFVGVYRARTGTIIRVNVGM